MKKFELIEEYHDPEVIRDVENQINFLFLATSGFGTNRNTLSLAKRVVDFLNSLPKEETELRPAHYIPHESDRSISKC